MARQHVRTTLSARVLHLPSVPRINLRAPKFASRKVANGKRKA